eukprot:357597-Chlamydomonas_euryale.AAC.1
MSSGWCAGWSAQWAPLGEGSTLPLEREDSLSKRPATCLGREHAGTGVQGKGLKGGVGSCPKPQPSHPGQSPEARPALGARHALGWGMPWPTDPRPTDPRAGL